MFTWGGDIAGQGYGINPDWGGYRLYEAMRKLQPDFFVHCGDHIYADNPLQAEVKLDDGTVWKNLVTEAKSKVAETLAEFRGNYRYNLLDDNSAASTPRCPSLASGTTTRCSTTGIPARALETTATRSRVLALLAARANAPSSTTCRSAPTPIDAERDLPLVPLRAVAGSVRAGPAELPRPEHGEPSADCRAGDGVPRPRADRLAEGDAGRVTATWKVIASDMPIGLIVTDRVNGQPAFEASPTATARRWAANWNSRTFCAPSKRTRSATWSG